MDDFDAALPSLKQQRDIAEHIDDYAVDSSRRHDKSVGRMQVEVGVLEDESWTWLGQEFNIGTALSAGEALFAAITRAGTFLAHAQPMRS